MQGLEDELMKLKELVGNLKFDTNGDDRIKLYEEYGDTSVVLAATAEEDVSAETPTTTTETTVSQTDLSVVDAMRSMDAHQKEAIEQSEAFATMKKYFEDLIDSPVMYAINSRVAARGNGARLSNRAAINQEISDFA